MQKIFEVYIQFEAGIQRLGFVDFGYRPQSNYLCQSNIVILLCLTYIRAHLISPYTVISPHVTPTKISPNASLVYRSRLRLEHEHQCQRCRRSILEDEEYKSGGPVQVYHRAHSSPRCFEGYSLYPRYKPSCMPC